MPSLLQTRERYLVVKRMDGGELRLCTFPDPAWALRRRDEMQERAEEGATYVVLDRLAEGGPVEVERTVRRSGKRARRHAYLQRRRNIPGNNG